MKNAGGDPGRGLKENVCTIPGPGDAKDPIPGTE